MKVKFICLVTKYDTECGDRYHVATNTYEDGLHILRTDFKLTDAEIETINECGYVDVDDYRYAIEEIEYIDC